MRLSISHFEATSDLGCKKELARCLSIGMEFIYILPRIFCQLFDTVVLRHWNLPLCLWCPVPSLALGYNSDEAKYNRRSTRLSMPVPFKYSLLTLFPRPVLLPGPGLYFT